MMILVAESNLDVEDRTASLLELCALDLSHYDQIDEEYMREINAKLWQLVLTFKKMRENYDENTRTT